MKRNLLFWIAGLLFIASCKDDKGFTPNDVVLTAFDKKFPAATQIEWKENNTYDVADFIVMNQLYSAWFDNMGKWFMTEIDLDNFAQLPVAVQTAFKASKYKDWKTEDFERLDRLNSDTIYVIEVEQGDLEFDLFYSTGGVLIKAVPDFDNDNNFDDFLPDYTIPAAIKTYIETNYSGARIVELDNENGNIEVDIIHDNKGKEILFSLSYTWISTHYDVLKSEVEATTTQAFEASMYKAYYIDDIEKYETTSGIYYIYELENGNIDIDIKITTAGVITIVP